MRHLIVVAALCAAGCAGQPSTPPAAGGATAAVAGEAANPAATKPAKVVPERIKGPYKIVMKGDKKLYCTKEKEKATGSHVNFRTICLTPEEYAEVERRSREWKDVMNSGITPPSGPAGPGTAPN